MHKDNALFVHLKTTLQIGITNLSHNIIHPLSGAGVLQSVE